MPSVEIVEVGPRDGVQSVPTFIPTEEKLRLINGLLDAGVKRLEIGSFVSPKAIPQMQDIAEIISRLGTREGVRPMTLVPNLKGAKLAVAAGMKEIIFVISMTESHNQSNVRRSVAQSIEELRALLEEVDAAGRLRMRVDLSCAFHCPFEGRVHESAVVGHLKNIVAIRKGMEIGLCDTTGFAISSHVRELFARCIREFGDQASWAFHCHDTAGFALANVLAAYEAGVRTFDASVAGLGGCPFAPGATGNVATEDVIYLFHRMGVDTGIDLDRFLDACAIATGIPDGVTGGHVLHIPRARVISSLAGG
ncbi:MAG TPA: hydroxymethylglutaryl-CoA lyase [Gammaproteobacteria bacterium]|nr:hydroxymethylglutaryl-CoA lyase [Gammaproteobacteria bacterium]